MRRSLPIVALLLVLSLGFLLRLHRLGNQSLWNDEGTSVALAARSLPTITRDASHDIHPPLYYYLLHIWVRLVGRSEFAVRSLSAFWGMLLLALIYTLGKRLAEGAAMGAVFIAALSPLLVYYSQEARMYILVTLLGALSFWCFVRWMDELFSGDRVSSGPRSVAYVVATTLMMYTHYFAFTLVVAQNLLFAVRWVASMIRRERVSAALRPVVRWAAAQLVILACFSPWLWVVQDQLRNWPAVSEPFGLLSLLRRVLQAFSGGLSAVEGRGWLYALVILIGVGWLGWAWWARRSDGYIWWKAGVVWAYLGVPVLIMYLLSRQRPMYDPKFLLLAMPAYAMLLAQALVVPAWRSRLAIAWSVVGIALVLALSVPALRRYYYNPRYARDDYRGIARYIEAMEKEADAILINAPGQYETFIYYYRGRAPIYPLPRQRPLDRLETEKELERLAESARYIYAILWATDESDPDRFIEGWLDQHAYKATDTWYGNVRLVIYALPEKLSSETERRPLNALFAGQIVLRDYALLTPRVAAGEVLQLTLSWEALRPISERYKVFIHVVDGHEHIVGQRDTEPGGGAKITPIWRPGEEVTDNHGVLILPGVPPGSYRVALGLYRLDDGQRLPITLEGKPAGDRLFIGVVTVERPAAPPPKAALDMRFEVAFTVGQCQLWGYNLTKLGQEHDPDAPIRSGDILHLTLFWHALAHPTQDLEWLIQLVDSKGVERAARRSPPLEGDYPTKAWRAGDVIRDQHLLHLPADLAPGRYRLLLSVYDRLTGELLLTSRSLGSVNVRH